MHRKIQLTDTYNIIIAMSPDYFLGDTPIASLYELDTDKKS